MSAADTAIATGKRAVRAALWQWSSSGRHELDDRRRGAERLVIVLAGYKEVLWPHTLDRIERAMPEDTDVCLVVAGRDVPELRTRAATSGWSYLTTQAGAISMIQNLAIKLHPRAQRIHKIDEDMLLGEGYFLDLEASRDRAIAEQRYDIAVAAPVINVNTVSFEPFLRTLGLEEEFERAFGPRQIAMRKLQTEPEPAIWLWERTLPFDDVARRFRAEPFGWSVSPYRFSIGAILFERPTWERMRGFRRPLQAPGLGVDEMHINASVVNELEVTAVMHDVLAGHFAYGGAQEAGVRAAFGDLSAFAMT